MNIQFLCEIFHSLVFPDICNLHKHLIFYLHPIGPFVLYCVCPKENKCVTWRKLTFDNLLIAKEILKWKKNHLVWTCWWIEFSFRIEKLLWSLIHRDSLYERRLLIKEQDQEFFKKVWWRLSVSIPTTLQESDFESWLLNSSWVSLKGPCFGISALFRVKKESLYKWLTNNTTLLSVPITISISALNGFFGHL